MIHDYLINFGTCLPLLKFSSVYRYILRGNRPHYATFLAVSLGFACSIHCIGIMMMCRNVALTLNGIVYIYLIV